MKPVFLDIFKDADSVMSEFNIFSLNDGNILFAYYSYEDYSGEAFVLLERDGKLFEVNGSHCSCYGLENQWSEEEVDLKELRNRLTVGTFGQSWHNNENKFSKELLGLIDEYEKQDKISVNITVDMPKEFKELTEQMLSVLKYIGEQDTFNRELSDALIQLKGTNELLEKRLEELEYRFERCASLVKKMHKQFQEIAKIEE